MLARIENGNVVETRDISLTDIPEHKRSGWLPVEGDAPAVSPHNYIVSGPEFQVEQSRVLRVWTVTPRDLAEVKARAKQAISVGAEAARGRYITAGSGKAMSYQQVAEEAVRYVGTNGAGGASDYPFLQARVQSGRYADLASAAQATLAIQQQWALAGSAIDRIEDAAKLAIDAAATVEAVASASQVTWP